MSNIKNPCVDCKYSTVSDSISVFIFTSNHVFCNFPNPHINDDSSCDDFLMDSNDNIKNKLSLLLADSLCKESEKNFKK